MNKICHVVNPFFKNGILPFEQVVTLESLVRAKNFSQEDVPVKQIITIFPEDSDLISDTSASDVYILQTSSEDLYDFKYKRKLPLIEEILKLAIQHCDCNIVVYTNIDISVMPQFYSYICTKMENECDALVINRRTIKSNWSSVSEIHKMYSSIGIQHPGHDCFCFKKEYFKYFTLGNTLVGANHFGKVLYANLYANIKRFEEIYNHHLTFHIGDEKAWANKKYIEYDEYNRNQCKKILLDLEQKHGEFDRRKPPGIFYRFLEESRLRRVYLKLRSYF
jgi:hypothetical protein